MKTVRWYSRRSITFAVDSVAVVVANIVRLNQNIYGGIKMLRLQDEIDPRIVQPKHLKDKKIIYRRGDDILISKVIVIAEQCYVLYHGMTVKLIEMDGWTQLPIVNYL